MKTIHGIGLGLVGLMVSTIAFAAAPVASQVMEEIVVTARYPAHLPMEEIIVTARHPDAKSSTEFAAAPVNILTEDVIHAEGLTDQIVFKPEIRLNL